MWGQVYHADIHTHSANKGIEGVAYDPARGLAYAVVEKTPMRVLAFDLDANVESAEVAAISELFDADSALGPGAGGAGVTDLAGIAYLAPPLDQLAILSQARGLTPPGPPLCTGRARCAATSAGFHASLCARAT